MYETFEDWYENECNQNVSEKPDLDEEVVIERSKFLDENGVDIRTKKSKDKTGKNDAQVVCSVVD